jgi:condensin complex subunit 3
MIVLQEGRDATESQFGDDRTDAGRPPQRAPVFRATEGMDEETKARMEIIDVRCLALCIGMLERVNSVSTPNIMPKSGIAQTLS